MKEPYAAYDLALRNFSAFTFQQQAEAAHSLVILTQQLISLRYFGNK